MAEETLRLPGNPKGAVLRFAPNPNGPLSIGHARGVVTNHYLAAKYGGKFILRFDDTDPKTKKPLREAYRWIVEDCVWLDAPQMKQSPHQRTLKHTTATQPS